MEILVNDELVLVTFSATNKKTFPKNEFNVAFPGEDIRIMESGTDIVQLKISDATNVTAITDSRTGGVGAVTPVSTLTALYDILYSYFHSSPNTTLGAINVNTDDLERGVWAKIPDNSLDIEYYVGVFAPSGNFGNPSGTTTNAKTLTYKTLGVDVFYQDFAYDSADGAIKVTARE